LKRLDLHESSLYSYSCDFVASSDPLKMFIDLMFIGPCIIVADEE